MTGTLNLSEVRAAGLPPAAVARLLIADLGPKPVYRPPLSWRLRQGWKNLWDGSYFIPAIARLARRLGLMVEYSELYGRVIHADGTSTNYGLLGRRVVTDAGVAYLAADMAAGANDINLFKFHGYGTGSTAESAAHTALVTELTTEYAGNVRPTGSQGSSTNTYTTVATLTPDSGGTIALREHGIFTANAAGTMWDRTLFAAINLDSTAGDSLQTTYTATFPSGS